MNRTMKRLIAVNLLAVALLSAPSLNAASLDAGSVLPERLLTNKNYKIDSSVFNDGLINTYFLETSYGQINVEGTPLLLVRTQELDALARMRQLEQSDVFKQALEKSVSSPIRGAAALIDDPIPTLKNAAQGIGKWFTDVGRAIVSDDPHQANVAKTALGQSTAKRDFAYEFGVDPYSSFRPLQEKLDSLAWAAAGGGLTVKVAFSAIPDVVGAAVNAVGTTDSMRALVRDSSPAHLEKVIRNKLQSMAIPKKTMEALLGNAFYTPQEVTILVGVMERLKSIRGREKLVSAAARADSEARAVFMRYRVQMIADYVQKTKAKGEFVVIDQTIFTKTDSGTIAGHFPVDSIQEAPEFSSKLASFNKAIGRLGGVKQKAIFVGGRVDAPVLAAMKKSGWEVAENQFR